MNESPTQSPWKSFYYTTAGTIMLVPVFVHWCACELRSKLIDWDETLSAELRSQRRFWLWISRAGDGWLYSLVFFVSRRNRIAECCFLAWGMGSALKILIRRPRQNPVWASTLHRFRRRLHLRIELRLLTKLSWSFPSQHAAVAVAFACALPNPLTIALAAAICASRVFTGAHYLGDVVAGVVVGLVAGRLA